MLSCQKSLFGISPEVTYLNCAYMGPMLQKVSEVGKEAIERKSDPSGISVNDFFAPTELLRKEFAGLIHCQHPERVATIPSVSYGIANVIRNLHLLPKSKIIIAGEQFPSNAYPWFRAAEEYGAIVEVINAPDAWNGRGRKWNQDLIAAIDHNTSVVAISHCHWADGTLFDLEEIRHVSNKYGAALIIDGTQSIGAMPFDWGKIQPDALICAGYKWLLGPYSIGLACYGPRFDEGTPIEENWINRKNSEDFAGLVEYEEEYQPGALRYEVGEHSNFILVPMLLESIRQIRTWGPENIQNYCGEITKEGIERLVDHGFWVENENWRGRHLFGIRLPQELEIDLVKKELAEEKIFVSMRGTSIRVAPYLYNTREDLHKLADCLIKLI